MYHLFLIDNTAVYTKEVEGMRHHRSRSAIDSEIPNYRVHIFLTLLVLSLCGPISTLAQSAAELDAKAKQAYGIPTVQVLDGYTGNQLIRLPEREPVVSLAFAPDGSILATSNAHEIKFWETRTGKRIQTIPSDVELTGPIVFIPRRNEVTGVGVDGGIRTWNIESGQLTHPLIAVGSRPTAVAFDTAGHVVAVALPNGDIDLWDLSDRVRLRRLSVGTDIPASRALAFSPDGKLLVAGSDDKVARVWSVPESNLVYTLQGHGGAVLAVAFSPDGLVLATGSGDGTCKTWDLKTGKQLRTFRGHTRSVVSIAFHPDPQLQLWVSGSLDHTIKTWISATGSEIRTTPTLDAVPSTVVFSPDGAMLASATDLRTAQVNNLYVLSAGVDRYKSANIASSKYARSDAESIASALRVGSTYFNRTEVTVLAGETASRRGIIEAFQRLASEVRSSDTFVFYFAGMDSKRDNDYYLLPSDSELHETSRTGISLRSLNGWMTKISATKKLILLDSIDGHAALASFSAQLQEENPLLRELLSDRDLTVITTNMTKQAGLESFSVGSHGLFASAILEGLLGGADYNSDGLITAHELAQFVDDRLRVATRGAESADSFSTGDDFPVASATQGRRSLTSNMRQNRRPVAALQRRTGGNVRTATNRVTYRQYRREFTLLGQNPEKPGDQDERGFKAGDKGRSPTNDGPPRKDYALLFAIDTYQNWPPLANPIKDAEDLESELRTSYGFKTELLRNPTQTEILTALRRYVGKGSIKYGPEDQLLVFFAGHGAFDDDIEEGYLVTKDSKQNDSDKVSYISHSDLRTILDHMRSRHVFLVLDSCFGGTFDPKWSGTGQRGNVPGQVSVQEFIHRKLRYPTRRYLTSGGKDYVPDGQPGHHSPFMRAFLEALRTYGGRDGVVTIEDIYSHMQMLQPEPHQNEFGTNEPGSDFLFVAIKTALNRIGSPPEDALATLPNTELVSPLHIRQSPTYDVPTHLSALRFAF
jgi:uncharacterized caspase-like protein